MLYNEILLENGIRSKHKAWEDRNIFTIFIEKGQEIFKGTEKFTFHTICSKSKVCEIIRGVDSVVWQEF